ncbi:MAG: hypothetical protein JWR00_3504 [Rubritepida sp.]|jgi:hypothetical protein|nr:hypothetical protein [Rubritepida sp.]
MRALKLLPLARRRCLMAAPANLSERLPDAASFYEPPRSPAEPEGRKAEDGIAWHSGTVTRIGHKE